MSTGDEGSGPVLPPSRFGAGFTVGGEPTPPPPPAYPSYPAPEPPASPYSQPVQYPSAPVQYPPAVTPYPVVMPVAYVPAQGTNGLAIAALVCPLAGCFLFPLGIIFGHIALSQIARTGESGRGLAIAGLVISYVILAVVLGYFLLGTALFMSV